MVRASSLGHARVGRGTEAAERPAVCARGLFMTVNVWKQQAEHVVESITTKGARVVVTGRLRQRTYELKDGSGKRTVLEVEADDVGVSLKFATAKVNKVSRSRTDSGATRPSAGEESDPWATEAMSSYSDQAPF